MNIAIWHHSKISGSGIPNPDFAFDVLYSQVNAMNKSGLSEAASEIHMGINGNDGDAMMLASVAHPKSLIHVHGDKVCSELPTQHLLQKWIPGHEDWLVLYHHTKGVTHPHEVAYNHWRWRMETACVENWRTCVADLSRGFDAAGCHWLTPEKYPGMVTSPFFGGTFWWAKASYLKQLPQLPEPTWGNRFEAESWIGRRRPYPIVRDYLPGWP